MFRNKEPDIEKLMKKGKIKQLIKLLTYVSPIHYNPHYPQGNRNIELEAKNKSILLRTRAAEALGAIGAEAAIEPLIEFIKEAHANCETNKDLPMMTLQMSFEAGTKALAAIRGEHAVNKLIAILVDSRANYEPYIRKPIVTALGTTGDERAIQPLIDVINNIQEEEYVRSCAVAAVSTLGTKSAIEPIINFYYLMQDRLSDYTKATIIKALITLGDLRLLIPIIAKKEEKLELQKSAAKGLRILGWQPESNEIGASFYILNDDWKACTEIGSPAVESLIFWLQRLDGQDECKQIIITLGDIGDERAVAPLLAILNRKYKPLYNEEDGEIYAAGYAEMDKHRERFLALQTVTIDALRKLSKVDGMKQETRESLKLT